MLCVWVWSGEILSPEKAMDNAAHCSKMLQHPPQLSIEVHDNNEL